MGKRSKRRKLKQKLERKGRPKPTKKNNSARHRALKPTSFRDNLGNIITPIELVFPIIKQIDEHHFEAVGTGFFVHPAGGFVTAKHCLFDGKKYNDHCYALHSVGKNDHLIRKIQYFEPHPAADVGVGMLKGQLRNRSTHEIVLKASFPISLTPPSINDKISTLAYPYMKISDDKLGTFPCDRFVGRILEHRPEGTAWLKSECFITNMEIKSGASGGPVLRNNHIIGVNSTSMELSPEDEPISFITPIIKVFDLTLKDSDGRTTTIQELIDKGYMPSVK
jgi:V8-like Glu-specific endopeptidase